MAIAATTPEPGIRVLTMSYPPVNALPTAGWFEIARLMREAGDNPEVRVVILQAEGRGFNAGVDIKEMQQSTGFDALIAANRGCFEAFKAIYECQVPVISAVHGFCLGGGLGLVGNSDTIIASEDAYFGVPEVDRGALGAATHLSRLVPAHKLRSMYYTGNTVSANVLHTYGSIEHIVAADQLHQTALAYARQISAKDPRVISAAKEALNGIDPIDVNRSYRFEQGFTFELNLAGVADEHRDAFADLGETLVT